MGKRKIASAIGYSRLMSGGETGALPADSAPRLLAGGRDRTAERIIAIAEQSGVPVIEDPGLAAMLDSGIKPGEVIPVWCWEAAAQILAFVLAKDRQ
jgi:flagellar biosynthesis protein FlhB